jgi:hypothetical protein
MFKSSENPITNRNPVCLHNHVLICPILSWSHLTSNNCRRDKAQSLWVSEIWDVSYSRLTYRHIPSICTIQFDSSESVDGKSSHVPIQLGRNVRDNWSGTSIVIQCVPFHKGNSICIWFCYSGNVWLWRHELYAVAEAEYKGLSGRSGWADRGQGTHPLRVTCRPFCFRYSFCKKNNSIFYKPVPFLFVLSMSRHDQILNIRIIICLLERDDIYKGADKSLAL